MPKPIFKLSAMALAQELQRINSGVDSECDIRLQLTADGAKIHTGASDYDQDHRGYWGASSLPGKDESFNAFDTALDLIRQAQDQYWSSRPRP